MNGKFILLKDRKPNKFGEYPISLRYSTQGVGVRKSTGIFVAPEHFIYDTGRNTKFIKTGREGHPQGDLLNKRLLNFKQEFDKTIASYMTEPNVKMTVPMLRSILNGKDKERKELQNGKVPFIQYVLDVNQDLYKKGKIGISIWQNIQCNMNVFGKYLKEVFRINTTPNNTLYCKDIKADILNGYIIWRLDVRKNSNNTINKSLTPIFKAVKKMARLGWISKGNCAEILDLYLETDGKSIGDSDENIQYLTEDQLRDLIVVAENAKYKKTKEIFDMFLFSLHCGGLRFSDICTLKWEEVDMENRVIRHLQVKNHTKKPKLLLIPISNEGMKILEKWVGKNRNFIFGQLPDDFNLKDEKKFIKRKNSRNKTVNQSLRTLGNKINLPFNLHIHCSRHSFATLALNKGVEISKVSSLLGHSGTWVTEKVYASYLLETMKQEVDEKLNFNFH